MLFANKQRNSESLWLLLILAIAAALRFYHYGSFSYSNDELSALNRLHYDTFSELVTNGFYIDGHPGGIQIFLWQWVRYFGDSEWAVRLPFVIFGILAVWMSYKVARFMFGTTAGLFTAAAITFLQFPLLYSQIARPYGPGMLFSLMLVYYWLKIFFSEDGGIKTQMPKFKHLLGFTLSAALCMYTHYFSFLFALIVGFSGFVVARRNTVFRYITSALFAALLFVPHIPITLNHLTYKGVGLWLGVPGKGWMLEHLYFIFDHSLFVLVLFFITLLALVYLYRENKNNLRFRLFLAAWFLLPAVIGYIYSVKVSPVLQHPVLIFSFPSFIILIFSYAGEKFDRKKQWILALFLAAGILSTTAVNPYYSKQHFGEFKDIARLTAQWQQEFGDSNITKTININNPLYIEYYLNRLNARARFDLYKIDGTEGLKALSETVMNSQKPYFLYATTKPTPDEGEDIIRSAFPYIVDWMDYGQYSKVILFSKVKGESFEKANHLTKIKALKADLKPDTVIADLYGNTVKAFTMDSTSEYSPGIELNFNEFRKAENLIISAETDLLAPLGSGDAVLVISLETADGNSIFWKGAVAKYVEIQGKWCTVINTLKITTAIPEGAKVKVYFWNKDKKVMYIRGLKCGIYMY